MLNFKTKPIIAMLHLKGNSDEEVMEGEDKVTWVAIKQKKIQLNHI